MRDRILSLICVLLLGAGLAGCKLLEPPKYVKYHSEFEDFYTMVPWGWSVYQDPAKDPSAYYRYTFVGPFDPDFYHGVPTIHITWYGLNRRHVLPDGTAESYFSPGHFIDTLLRDVYFLNKTPEHQLVTLTRKTDKKGHLKSVDDKDFQRVVVSGWEATHFVVSSPVEVAPSTRFGISQEKIGSKLGARIVVLRKHNYVVLPMDTGFYVLAYPSTLHGYEKFIKQFNFAVKKFHVVTDGPKGPKVQY